MAASAGRKGNIGSLMVVVQLTSESLGVSGRMALMTWEIKGRARSRGGVTVA